MSDNYLVENLDTSSSYYPMNVGVAYCLFLRQMVAAWIMRTLGLDSIHCPVGRLVSVDQEDTVEDLE